jgi:hypothetical protein
VGPESGPEGVVGSISTRDLAGGVLLAAVENILSIVATCRQQQRSVSEFLAICFENYLIGTGAPSLLPRRSS